MPLLSPPKLRKITKLTNCIAIDQSAIADDTPHREPAAGARSSQWESKLVQQQLVVYNSMQTVFYSLHVHRHQVELNDVVLANFPEMI